MSFTGALVKNSTEWHDYLAEDKGGTELAVIWTFTGIALVFASARWYVRAWVQHKLWSDDYLIAVSVVSYATSSYPPPPPSPRHGNLSWYGHVATGIVACALTSVSVSKGVGRHVEALSNEQRISATLWVYAAYCPSVLSFGMPKLAVIALLVRLLVPSRIHFWILWAMGALVQLALLESSGSFWQVPAYSLRCRPVDRRTLLGHQHLASANYLGPAFSAFVDFYLAAYPSIVLYKLQMARRKKIILSIALGLGVV
ncbi:hypothetical protein PG994_003423 [Apiospora phragmitis]|uniref:Rhodopsin domain-containing protein n=1 Tax=Apiospora phragmitis TaxID=2905665 RepID=A0ABR1VY08_9PEZI